MYKNVTILATAIAYAFLLTGLFAWCNLAFSWHELSCHWNALSRRSTIDLHCIVGVQAIDSLSTIEKDILATQVTNLRASLQPALTRLVWTSLTITDFLQNAEKVRPEQDKIASKMLPHEVPLVSHHLKFWMRPLYSLTLQVQNRICGHKFQNF